MSSVTMVLAVKAGTELNKNKVILWLGLTIVGGFIFLGSQAWEWAHFISGDKGAVQTKDGEVLHVVNQEGEIMSLHELILNEPKPHGSHAHFTTQAMRASFAGNESVTLKQPGKAGRKLDRAEAESVVETATVIQGANLRENEYGNVLFGDFFFFITGFHGFHVFSGVVINIIIFINVIMGTYERRGHYEMVEKVGLYWHFVDLVWVFVFTFFYLV
jgi:cytochrome c oxidase subunit 3